LLLAATNPGWRAERRLTPSRPAACRSRLHGGAPIDDKPFGTIYMLPVLHWTEISPQQ
jgi:hypothetical protein